MAINGLLLIVKSFKVLPGFSLLTRLYSAVSVRFYVCSAPHLRLFMLLQVACQRSHCPSEVMVYLPPNCLSGLAFALLI